MLSNLKGVGPIQKPHGISAALFWLALVFLACVSVGIAGASLLWPLSWDEGIFAWIGGVLARGGTPYVDAWDVKGPIAYFGYALANTLLGTSAHAVRILDLLLTLAGTVAVFRLLRKSIDRSAAMIAALLLFVSVLGQGYNVNGQPDLWAGWCLVAVVTLVSVPGSVVRVGVAAMFLGVAVLIKPTYAAMGLLLLVPIASSIGKDWRAYSRYAVAIIVGGAFPIALCAAWFWSRGALSEFWSAYIGFNVESGASNHRALSGVVNSILSFLISHRAVLVSIPAIVVGLSTSFRSTSAPIAVWRTRLLATWILTLFALVILQNRFFSYHWAPLYPPLAVAAGIGFHRLMNRQQNEGFARLVRGTALAAVALIAVGASLAPLRQITRAARLVTHRITTDEYLAAFDDYPGVQTAGDVRLAANYVKAHTQLSDYVFVWEDPNVNVLSGRPTPGRFAFWTPLISSGEGAMTPRYEAHRAEFFRTLEQRPPALLLMERAAWRDGNTKTIANVPTKFPEFMHWIEERYVVNDSAGAFLVFKKR